MTYTKEQQKEYRSRPEVKAHRKEQQKEYRSRPEVKAHRKEQQRKRDARRAEESRRFRAADFDGKRRMIEEKYGKEE